MRPLEPTDDDRLRSRAWLGGQEDPVSVSVVNAALPHLLADVRGAERAKIVEYLRDEAMAEIGRAERALARGNPEAATARRLRGVGFEAAAVAIEAGLHDEVTP